MANKLRNKTARVSFFAFQDMITAVTGVLMVVMLMLSLNISQHMRSPSAVAQAALRRQVEQARQQLASGRQTLDQLQSHLAAQNNVFVIPEADRSGKTVVLIALSATKGTVSRLDQSNLVQFSPADFPQVLQSLNPAHDRVVFYVRPSGISAFDDCRKLVIKRGYSYGYDTADEDSQYSLTPH